MKKSLLMIGLGFLLALPSTGLQAASTVQLSGHVPEFVRHLQSKGHLAETNLNLAIGLPVRDEEGLTALLQQINDPASTNYHKYLSPKEFTEQFGPSEQDYAAVVDFARKSGLKVTQIHGNRMLLDVSGLSTDIEKAFQVNFKIYRHPVEARDFYATDVEPSVPAGLPVADISGLNNLNIAHSNMKRAPKGRLAPVASSKSKATPADIAAPQVGTGPSGNYMGNDFRNAYIPGSTLNGSGQNVALVEFDGYFASDIVQYNTMAGRTNVPLTNILIDGYTGGSGPDNGEVCLDIEMLVSIAPALSNIIVYEEPNGGYSQNDIMNRIATDDSANQISCSWSWGGAPHTTTDHIFQEMALQGQTFFTAAGDSCAFPAGTVDTLYVRSYPSDSPYVTSVGGTTLTMTAGGAAKVSETVWNWGVEFGSYEDGAGTCGGISTYYKIPYWQTNVSMTACQGSSSFRNFPDVGLTADNLLVISDGGQVTLGNGGTSAATPLWAGFTAMINQQGIIRKDPPIGFINPALYSLANTANYTNYFNDITTGNNTWSGSPNLFYAVTNYDLCTGLGSPNGTNLINALTAPLGPPVYVFHLSAPPQPYGTNMAAMNGGTPNGEWTLFIGDEGHFNSGMISNGWSVTVTLGTPLGAVADLDLTMTNCVGTVEPGSNVVFYLAVTNYGVSTASNVVVVDTLPNGVSYVSGNPSTGFLNPSATAVTWAVGNLLSGAGASLALTLQAPTELGAIVNLAVAQSDTPIVNTADDSATATVIVGAPTVPQLGASYTATNGAFTLTITGSTASATVIYASTNLVSWTPIFTNSAPYASPFTFTDTNRTKYPYRFYQAKTLP